MKNLTTAIKVASVFSAKNDVRYYLNGIALTIVNEKIVSVCATDGTSLVVIGIQDTTNLRGAELVIIDNADVATLERAIGKNEEYIKFKLNEVGDLVIDRYTIPVMDGRFPDVKRVIPESKRTVDIDNGISVDTKLLVKLDKTQSIINKSLPKKNSSSMRMKFGSESDSVLCEFTVIDPTYEFDQYNVVIMPKRQR